MKALIIGGNRYFGKRLASLLLERGDEVALLNRGQLADGFGHRVKRITLDRRELKPNHPLLGDGIWDVVFDQACYDAAEAEGACQAFRGRVGRYIFTSSQSVYGPGAKIPETAFDPRKYSFKSAVHRDQDYSEAKRQAESVFYRDSSFAVTSVRFPIVLGEDDYTGRLQFHIDHVVADQPIYFPDIAAKISFIHSADAARVLEHLADHLVPGPINAAADDPLAPSELMTVIRKKTGRKPRIKSVPGADPSPYGTVGDWYMDTQKLRNSGFTARPVLEWLPSLVESLMGTF